MGKSDKVGLGRALVKHHNQMVQQSKDKAAFYRSSHNKVLESFTDINEIDAVLENFDNPNPFPLPHQTSTFKLDKRSDLTTVEAKEIREREEAVHLSSLRVPRRPAWTPDMSIEVLECNENNAFLSWRRKLASLEQNEDLVLTPFEKNLDIWRQLWRVLERSDLVPSFPLTLLQIALISQVVMVVDARDPLFYRCPDVEDYAREIDPNKKTLLLVNKADLLPYSVRKEWGNYFHENEILYLFWSAKAAMDGKEEEDGGESSTKIYTRDELLSRLQIEAEKIVNRRRRNVVVGFVGYPNVGKSSTINALVGQKRTGVTSTPGKTKHFQTLIISEELTLCDCPGLVFPSFASSRYEMIASGVLPIDRMTEHREAVQVVANRVPRPVIEAVYNISLPKPKPYEAQSRPPLASEFLRAFCASRGFVSSSGLPDETRAARQILKDFIEGKIPHWRMLPSICDRDEGARVSPEDEGVLDNLVSFDLENGLAVEKKRGERNGKGKVSNKHHKKPQRKKDRTWRVGNDGVDGMPVARVFQKPVNSYVSIM